MSTRLADADLEDAGFTSGWLGRVAETVVSATEPQVRSAALLMLVAEIYTTAEWMLGPSTDDSDELASLGRVLAEVQDHQRRMTAGSGLPDFSGTP